MPHPATTEKVIPRNGRTSPTSANDAVRRAAEPSTARELRAAFDAIPADSVTARTAGALRVADIGRTIEEERAAFEQAVADENAGLPEG